MSAGLRVSVDKVPCRNIAGLPAIAGALPNDAPAVALIGGLDSCKLAKAHTGEIFCPGHCAILSLGARMDFGVDKRRF